MTSARLPRHPVVVAISSPTGAHGAACELAVSLRDLHDASQSDTVRTLARIGDRARFLVTLSRNGRSVTA